MNNYFMETHHHEWILSNKKGSYALGTGNLINQRKYHGLLIASDSKFCRTHLVAGIEEKVEWRGEVLHLDSNNYSNCIYPEGFLHLVKPWILPYPIFLYSSLPHQNEILIRKEIMMDKDSNTVIVKYTNLGHHKLHFTLHPKFTMLPHHEINAPGSLDWEQIETSITSNDRHYVAHAKRISNNSQVFIGSTLGVIESNRYVYYNVYYPWEVMNGYSGIGDQISLFEITFDLGIGSSNYIILSDENLIDRMSIVQRIEAQYDRLPKPLDYPQAPDIDNMLLSEIDYGDNRLFKYDDYMRILENHVKSFIANQDIVAGYPYYGAWGRDTMFVLNAILRIPDCIDSVERILRKYSRNIQNGLIPNVFPETGREANYETVDASLWYIILLWKLGKIKNSRSYWEEIFILIEDIIINFMNNTQNPYFVRADFLIEIKPEFAHATWMDSRIAGAAVCPRDGAPIEINALWYNATKVYTDLLGILNKTDLSPAQQKIITMTEILTTSLQKYWIGDYLADRLIDNEPVSEIRPNALIALSLPFGFLDQEKQRIAIETASTHLLTSYGLRTISYLDSKFRKKYYGNQKDRDLARYNGSVWAWLLSPFCGSLVKAYKSDLHASELASKLEMIISSFRDGFMKGHIASVAEIWDGDSPHFPKGSPASAMSVAALYSIESYIRYLRRSI